MKIGQIFDKRIDQTQIESNYLWSSHNSTINPSIFRVNLSTSKIDLSITPSSNSINILIALPNNQFFGVQKWIKGQQYFISDENLSMKIIFNFNEISYPCCFYASCFYNDSIFIFENHIDFDDWNSWIYTDSYNRRYLISQNKWEELPTIPFRPILCIGFNQKIIFSMEKSTRLWIYDINLSSYSYHLPIKNFDKTVDQTLAKHNCKLYLLIFSNLNKIYCCEDPLSDWDLIYKFRAISLSPSIISHFSSIAYIEDSIYYLKKQMIYKFNLRKFDLRGIGEFKDLKLEEKMQDVELLEFDLIKS